MYALSTRRAAHPAQIRAGLRLCHCDGADQFAGGETWQPALFLLLTAVLQDVWCNDSVVQRDSEIGKPDAVEFLDDHDFVPERPAGSAISLRHAGAQQSSLAGTAPCRWIDTPFVPPAIAVRHDFALHEAPHRVAHQAQFLDDCRVHLCPSSYLS